MRQYFIALGAAILVVVFYDCLQRWRQRHKVKAKTEPLPLSCTDEQAYARIRDITILRTLLDGGLAELRNQYREVFELLQDLANAELALHELQGKEDAVSQEQELREAVYQANVLIVKGRFREARLLLNTELFAKTIPRSQPASAAVIEVFTSLDAVQAQLDNQITTTIEEDVNKTKKC